MQQFSLAPHLLDASVTLGSLVNHEDAISSLMNEHDVGVLIGVLGSDAAKRRDVASKFLKPVFRVLQKIGSSPKNTSSFSSCSTLFFLSTYL